jgi:hypothetical protein
MIDTQAISCNRFRRSVTLQRLLHKCQRSRFVAVFVTKLSRISPAWQLPTMRTPTLSWPDRQPLDQQEVRIRGFAADSRSLLISW